MITLHIIFSLETTMRLPTAVSTLALVLMTAAGPSAWAQKCAANEVALYEGNTGKKGILVCATPTKPPYTKIEYRFGTPEKIEMTYTADAASGRKFYDSKS